MDCNELLRRQLANRLVCQSQQIAIGPTGPTGYNGYDGSTGPTGAPAPIIGLTRSFTIFIDYSSVASISRLYIPPGLFTTAAYPGLSDGGVFTTDQGSDLIFLTGAPGFPLNTITMANTTNSFCVGITVSGYVSTNGGEWNPSPGGNISNTQISYSQTSDYSIKLKGLSLTSINGASLTPRPTTGVAAGFLATVTLFYV